MRGTCYYHTAFALILCGAFHGCGSEGEPQQTHHAHGPHDGHLVDLEGAEGYRVEFALEPETRKLVVCTLDAISNRPRPITSPSIEMTLEFAGQDVRFELLPVRRETEPQGQASRFEMDMDKLPQQMKAEEEFVAEFTLTIDGQTVSGRLDHRNDHTHQYHHD
jgi:hypothetical protein